MEIKKFSGLIFLFLSLANFVSADPNYYGCSMGGMMSGQYGSAWMFFGWLTGLLVIVALVLLVVWLIKQIKK